MTATPDPLDALKYVAGTTSAERVRLAYQVLIEPFMKRCADAGYGRFEKRSDGSWYFEAFPGCEDAAADWIAAAVGIEGL